MCRRAGGTTAPGGWNFSKLETAGEKPGLELAHTPSQKYENTLQKKKFGSDKPHPTFLSTASDGMDIKSSPSKRKFFSCDVADWGKSKREGSTPQRDSRVHEDALGLHGVGYDTPDAFSYCMGVLCVCMCITGTQ